MIKDMFYAGLELVAISLFIAMLFTIALGIR